MLFEWPLKELANKLSWAKLLSEEGEGGYE